MNSVAESADKPGAAATFNNETKALRREIHTVLKQIDFDYQRMQYNTVVSGNMKLLNALEGMAPTLGTNVSSLPPEGVELARSGPLLRSAAVVEPGLHIALREGFGILLRCLYPATPHIADALWTGLGYAKAHGSLLDAPWPEVDASALQQDEIELMLQINGKLRGSITVSAAADKATIEAAAISTDAFIRQAAGTAPKKVIVVPGRLVNIVV